MLSDNVLVVTGAGRGIGQAVAIELAKEGATVVVNDLGSSVAGEGTDGEPAKETVATIEAAGGTATAHVGDVTDPSYTESLLADATNAHGPVDGVANFAGVADPAPIHEMSLDQWERVLDVHLRGHFCLLRSAARQWIGADEDRRRSFLCVSSQSALGHYGMANYTTAKAGILGLTRTAANELDEHGVRVNALFPSGTTRLSDALTDDAYRDPVPPEQVAPMVAYLLSDAAADVTGCTLRAGGEEIGFVTDPEMSRLAYREGGWTAEAVAEQFPDITAEIDLDRSETLVSERYGLDADGMGG